MSGTRDSQFVKYCDGKMTAYYLWQHLNLKPGLNEAFRAGIPEHCSIESDKLVPKLVPSTDTSNIRPKKNKRYMENISDTIINHILLYICVHSNKRI